MNAPAFRIVDVAHLEGPASGLATRVEAILPDAAAEVGVINVWQSVGTRPAGSVALTLEQWDQVVAAVEEARRD